MQPSRSCAKRLAAVLLCRCPTRAHALWPEAGGTLLAVARRPGDWLLRWRVDGRPLAWAWSEPDRAFNGHVLASPDGQLLYTTETDLDSGAGLLGVRHAASLEKLDEWPTHGMDPHALVWDGQGGIVVANGGIPTLPETGRLKIGLDRMDANLARLAGRDGELLGQWRLADRRLSLRHLAWNGALLGIALQAEHDEAEARDAAPLFARFDGQRLAVSPAPRPLGGYGGDIAPVGEGWAVGCPRANGVALYRRDGGWAGFVPLVEACALSAGDDGLWAGGREAALAWSAAGSVSVSLPALQLDNHWVALAGAGAVAR